MKPVNMCNEVGCSREWTVEVTLYGLPYMAPRDSTGIKFKFCDPCAVRRGEKPAQAAAE
jgi:hypothetical protein